MEIFTRCEWVKAGDSLYEAYHDIEWGVPTYDDRKIFEFLVLESAQAGLSWRTILGRREGYRKAFKSFQPEKVATMTEQDIEKLLGNSEIIRNEKKIRSAIGNAERFLEVGDEYGTFANYIWGFVGRKPIQSEWKDGKEVPTTTKESDALAKDMKARGFTFLGSTILYAHMQATGMVNDHLVKCSRREECRKLAG